MKTIPSKGYIPFNGDRLIGLEIRKLVTRFKIKTIVETGMWSGHTTREFVNIMRDAESGRGEKEQRRKGEAGETFNAQHSTSNTESNGKQVVTIDNTFDHLIEEFGLGAVEDLERAGARVLLGDSGVLLPMVIREIEHPALFYLDAHGGGSNPLKEEFEALAEIQNSKLKITNEGLVRAMIEEDPRIDPGSVVIEPINYLPVIVIHDFQVPNKPWGFNGWGMEPLSLKLIEPWLAPIYPDGYDYHYNQEAEGCQRGVIYIYPK